MKQVVLVIRLQSWKVFTRGSINHLVAGHYCTPYSTPWTDRSSLVSQPSMLSLVRLNFGGNYLISILLGTIHQLMLPTDSLLPV